MKSCAPARLQHQPADILCVAKHRELTVGLSWKSGMPAHIVCMDVNSPEPQKNLQQLSQGHQDLK